MTTGEITKDSRNRNRSRMLKEDIGVWEYRGGPVVPEFPLNEENFNTYIKGERIIKGYWVKTSNTIELRIESKRRLLIYDRCNGGLRNLVVEGEEDRPPHFGTYVGGVFTGLGVVTQDEDKDFLVVNVKLTTSKGVVSLLFNSSDRKIKVVGRIDK